MADVEFDERKTVRLIKISRFIRIDPYLYLVRFAGNEHIVQPTLKDYEPTIPSPRTTFPTPIPPFLSRANPSIPSVPRRDSITANAGRYSLSLKGIRKRLRRAGPKTEQTIFDIEEALTTWLHTGAVVIQPDIPFVPPLGTTRTYVDTCQSIQELSRSVLQLIWKVDDDFFRFLLHCVARFHGVVSYSEFLCLCFVRIAIYHV